MRQKLTRQGHELALYRLSDTHGVGVQNVRPHTWDGFRLLSGEVKVYVKTAESGAKRHQGFCPVCGSPIYSTSDANGPKVFAIRTGTARQRNELIPRAQIWCHSEQAWTNHLGSIP